MSKQTPLQSLINDFREEREKREEELKSLNFMNVHPMATNYKIMFAIIDETIRLIEAKLPLEEQFANDCFVAGYKQEIPFAPFFKQYKEQEANKPSMNAMDHNDKMLPMNNNTGEIK